MSRERIGKELEGILSGNHARPALAMSYLHRYCVKPPVSFCCSSRVTVVLLGRFDLYDAVFMLPPVEVAEAVTHVPVPEHWINSSLEAVKWSNIILCDHNVRIHPENHGIDRPEVELDTLSRGKQWTA